MKKQDPKKKVWTKPLVCGLTIKKDTFGGSTIYAEGISNGAASVPKDPIPR